MKDPVFFNIILHLIFVSLYYYFIQKKNDIMQGIMLIFRLK